VLILVNISLQTKSEVHRFNRFNDITGASKLKKMDYVTRTTPICGLFG